MFLNYNQSFCSPSGPSSSSLLLLTISAHPESQAPQSKSYCGASNCHYLASPLQCSLPRPIYHLSLAGHCLRPSPCSGPDQSLLCAAASLTSWPKPTTPRQDLWTHLISQICQHKAFLCVHHITLCHHKSPAVLDMAQNVTVNTSMEPNTLFRTVLSPLQEQVFSTLQTEEPLLAITFCECHPHLPHSGLVPDIQCKLCQ